MYIYTYVSKEYIYVHTQNTKGDLVKIFRWIIYTWGYF